MATVPVKPELIRWAIKRSGLANDDLSRFPVEKWKSGEKQPTLKQLEDFARKTMTPVGYLLLDKPPIESLPIPDFRTKDDVPLRRLSPNLIDTLHDMTRRQAWMRDERREEGYKALVFVGGGKGRGVGELAKNIRETLELAPDWAEQTANWEAALRELRDAAERLGILVAASGMVGLNTSRLLDPAEFRGFVLIDEYAPLVFVNSADARSAQMFTLAHELVHVWLGQGGLFNLVDMQPASDATEKHCNQVAAEFLVPAAKLKIRWPEAKTNSKPFHTLAKMFKVSPLVAARRALDLNLIDKPEFFRFYRQQQEEWQKHKEEQREAPGGPNFYVVQDVRLGRSFALSVARATREGRLSYVEAYRLTGLKGQTFDRYADIVLRRLQNEQS